MAASCLYHRSNVLHDAEQILSEALASLFLVFILDTVDI